MSWAKERACGESESDRVQREREERENAKEYLTERTRRDGRPETETKSRYTYKRKKRERARKEETKPKALTLPTDVASSSRPSSL